MEYEQLLNMTKFRSCKNAFIAIDQIFLIIAELALKNCKSINRDIKAGAPVRQVPLLNS